MRYVVCRRCLPASVVTVVVVGLWLVGLLWFPAVSRAKVRALSVAVSVHMTSSENGHRVLVVFRTEPGAACWGVVTGPRRAGPPAYPSLKLPDRWAAANGVGRWQEVISAVAPPGLWTAEVTCWADRYGKGQSAFRVPEPGLVTQSSFAGPPRDSIGGLPYPRSGAVLVPGADWLSGHGVTVYSNNRCIQHSGCASTRLGAYGWGRQSVELFSRLVNAEGWYHGIITPGGNGGAQNLWTSAPSSAFDREPNGQANPAVGDAVLFGGGAYGHVAIVEWVGWRSMGIVEQNGSASGRAVLSLSSWPTMCTAPCGPKIGGEYGLRVIGLLHAKANRSGFSSAFGYPYVYEVAFQARSGDLWSVGYDQHKAWPYRLMASTSPSVAAVGDGEFEIAFQADTGELWIVGAAGTMDTGYLMAPGTSPSITGLPNGGFEVAFQAHDRHLWTIGSDMHGDWGYPVSSGTSPSITQTAAGSGGLDYEVAFQASTGSLWTVGSNPHGDWGYPMSSGTSPSITQIPAGSGGLDYEVAFQASTGSLWTVGSNPHGDWGLSMRPGTSPSVTQTPMGTNGLNYEVAFQASNGSLWTIGYDTQGTKWDWELMSDTSPSIAYTPSLPADYYFQYEIALTSADGTMYTDAVEEQPYDARFPMKSGTSPSITGLGSGPVQFPDQP